MTGLLEHLRKVNKDTEQRGKPALKTVPEPKSVGPFIWTETDGTEVEYEYDDSVIASHGDERMDDVGKVYWVPLAHLPEFDYHDESIQDNVKFWDWMMDYIERHDLKVVRQKRQRTTVKATDWGFGGAWDKGKKYLSDQWGGSKYFADYKNDDAKRFAVALQAVKSTVRVVDSHTRRLTVELADRDMQERRDNGEDFSPTSMTDFTQRRLFVSACALVDKSIEQGDAIDITTGFALHEASHGEYTEDVFPALDQPTRLMPLQTSGFLLNVIEDCRIEGLTSEQFPGFEAYFDKTNEYMWDKFVKGKAPQTWGPGLIEKLNSVVAIVKWGASYEDTARKDPILSDEFDWWSEWRDAYVEGHAKPRASLVTAMERLAEDPESKKEMDAQTKEEIQEGLDKKALSDALSDALKKNPDLLKPCTSVTKPGQHMPGLDVNVAQQTAERAKRLADEELQEDKVIKQQFPNGDGQPGEIVSLKPAEDQFSREQFKPPPAMLVQKMKTSFLMRPSAMEWTDRLQKSGSVDDDELWRAGAGDMRFFERKTVESSPDTSVALLVDMSGSMNGRKLRSASDAASIIHACTKDMRGVNVRVFGHTGDQSDSGDGNSVVYRIWEPGDPVTRLGTLMTQQKGDNYDGYALGWTVQQLIKNSTPEEQMIVFIISDGLPNGYGEGGYGRGGYGGDSAIDHIRDVVRWAERQGVDVIQIAIDPSLRAEEQERMYKHWLPFEDANALPGQVMGILKRIM